jgi:hypothetical protein
MVDKATTGELVTFELTHLLTRLARLLSLKPNGAVGRSRFGSDSLPTVQNEATTSLASRVHARSSTCPWAQPTMQRGKIVRGCLTPFSLIATWCRPSHAP